MSWVSSADPSENATSSPLAFLASEGNWGSEGLSEMPRVTRQLGGRGGTRAHACLL